MSSSTSSSSSSSSTDENQYISKIKSMLEATENDVTEYNDQLIYNELFKYLYDNYDALKSLNKNQHKLVNDLHMISCYILGMAGETPELVFDEFRDELVHHVNFVIDYMACNCDSD
jgi:ribosomal protein L16 Arg81 hydroxylase